MFTALLCLCLVGQVEPKVKVEYESVKATAAKPGDELVLGSDNDAFEDFRAAKDYFAGLEMMKLIKAEDTDGLAILVERGRLTSLPAGTRIKYIKRYESEIGQEVTYPMAEVRVLDGPKKDNVFFVGHNFCRRVIDVADRDKHRSILEALAKVEADSVKAANKGSRNLRNGIYRREYAKGFAKVEADYKFGKGELQPYLDARKPKED